MPVDTVDGARARAEELIARITADFDRRRAPRAGTVTIADVTDAIERDLAANDTRHLFLAIGARRHEQAVAAHVHPARHRGEQVPAPVTQRATWRRHHGSAIVAQVSSLALGRWDVSAWKAIEPSAAARSPRQMTVLMSAQAAADHLARTVFQHRCDLDGCGDWMLWP